MATSYRYSRNIEASIIDFLKANFDVDWTGVNIEKAFARVYELNCPVVCIRLGTTIHDKVEIGDNATIRTPQILIDIFATSDGQRLDLKDYIVEKIKDGLIYYDYIIHNGAVQSKTANGRIIVLSIDDTPLNFDVDKDKLDPHDRYRHLLTLSLSLGKIEA